MSAADFLFAPEVRKLLKVLYAGPGPFSVAELARRSRLKPEDAERTLEHLVSSGMLKRLAPEGETLGTIDVDPSFIFHGELRSIAFKSFAMAEPVRAMLRSRFKACVVRAFLTGEDRDGSVGLLVVYGQAAPDKADMSTACSKLSKSMHRHLKVDVVSEAVFRVRWTRDGFEQKLASGQMFEIIRIGDTNAQSAPERSGLLQSARTKLAMFSRPRD